MKSNFTEVAWRQGKSWVVLAALLLLTGCGSRVSYHELGLVSVSGRVTLDGQPLAGVTVRFEGPPNRFSGGKTDSGGRYRLLYDSNQAGCTPGEKIVRITAGGAGEGSDEETPIEAPDGKAAAPAQAIPAAYNSASTLTANVSSSNRSFNFDLKSMP
ncbi:carboxypeptidase-like regulatory domain-containing protein [Anatilimnocola floriformis]|uniref:carboxypeptidase-like regulatory domain-containing protein n=1 Tax=Anatilimnocola floriformis TaxID=2948575 RepID=UPI0020C3339F|nr:carboxypeptidase-like regulatory domain-containing protein [Anatilimnocola floriformis]